MKRLLIASSLIAVIGLAGCGTMKPIVNPLGDNSQQTVFNTGQDIDALYGPVDTAAMVTILPPQVCSGLKALNTAFFGAETTVRDPAYQNGGWAQAVVIASNSFTTLTKITAQLAINTFLVKKPKPKLMLSADPTPAQWETLNANLNSDLTATRC
jgi:hypothetical protein